MRLKRVFYVGIWLYTPMVLFKYYITTKIPTQPFAVE